MASFNKVILVGNLTRDPELRYTPKGMAIAKIGLAVNRVWRTEAGETKEDVTFVDVDAFGRQAETLAQYMKKGATTRVLGGRFGARHQRCGMGGTQWVLNSTHHSSGQKAISDTVREM